MNWKEHFNRQQEEKERLAMSRLLYKPSALYGPQGSGKTTLLVHIARKMTTFFNISILTIGQPIDFTEAFKKKYGNVQELSFEEFLDQLKMLNELYEMLRNANHPQRSKYFDEDLLNSKKQDDYILAMKLACHNRGVVLYNSLQLLDEARDLADRRKSMTLENRVMGQYFMKMRHILATLVLTIPDRKDFDDYVQKQINVGWRGEVIRNEFTEEIEATFRGKFNWSYSIHGPIDQKYFTSYNLLPFDECTIDKVLFRRRGDDEES